MMPRALQRALVPIAATCVAVLAWSGVAAEGEQGVRGPLLTVALNTDIRGTDPGVNRDANTDAVMHHIVGALVGYGEDLRIKPVVAESWQRSKDGRVYTFRLRSGLRFHNGEPVTSEEVAWSFRRYLNPDTNWKCRGWFVEGEAEDDGRSSVIESIDTPDENTVVFRLSEPNSLFLDRLANIQCISAVLHPASVDEEGGWVAPIGTGPYLLTEWRHGEYVDLERFDAYLPRQGGLDGVAGRKEALAERIRFIVSPDAAATKAAVMAGQIDLYPNVPMSTLEDFRDTSNTTIAQSPTLGWSVLLIQTRDPLLSDPRIRKAIAYAIDRQMVANFNTYGYASVNSSAVPTGSPVHTEVHDHWYEFDIGKARALLRDAGYRGQPIYIQANRKYQNMYANAVVIQAMLHAAGMNAHIQVMDWASHLGNYFSGKFQLSTFSFSALVSPTMRYYKLIGDKDRRPVYMWENPRAVELLETAIATFDENRQIAVFEDLHRLMLEDVPIIGLYNAHNAAAVLDGVHSYQPWPLAFPRLWGVWKESWRD